MRKFRAFTAVFMVSILALALLLTSCGGEKTPSATNTTDPTSGQPGETSPAANQPEDVDVLKLVGDTITATNDVTTVKMDMEYIMSTEVIGGAEAGTMTMQATGNIQINAPEKEMAMTMDMAMEMDIDNPTQIPFDTTMEMYMVDEWTYTRVSIPMMGDQWMKMKLTDEVFEEQSQLGDMAQFLESAIDYEIVGSEILHGVDCYILKVTPEMDVLMDWAMSQQTEAAPEMTEEDMASSFKNFEVKEWIAKDSKRLMREMITISMEYEPDASGEDFEKMTMNMSGTLDYYDFGKPIKITLPPEALNAPEMPEA